MSRIIPVFALAIFLSTASHTFGQTKPAGDSVPAYDNAEAYKVYDALFRYMGENQHLHGDKLAIMANTMQVEDMALGVCRSQQLTELPADAFADLKSQNSHAWRLQPRIPVGRYYSLISDAATANIELEGVVSSASPEDQAREPKPEYKGYWQLSAVGFNQAHDKAIVSTFYTCGTTCGFGGPFVLSKHGEAWQVDKWVCEIVS